MSSKGLLPESIHSDATCTARLSMLYPHFTKADRAVANMTISHPQTIAKLSAREMARQCGVSEASVIRFVQKLGYEGLTSFKRAVHHELVTSQTQVSFDLPSQGTPAEALSAAVAFCSQALQNLLEVLDPDELGRAAKAVEAADCVHFFAAGGSMRVAQNAAFKLIRMGYLAFSEADSLVQMAQASLTGSRSVAVAVSFTGATKQVVDALGVARESGATTVCLTNFAGTPVTKIADIQLITGAPGGILAANSAPARTAQFAVLDALFALIPPRDGGEEAARA